MENILISYGDIPEFLNMSGWCSRRLLDFCILLLLNGWDISLYGYEYEL